MVHIRKLYCFLACCIALAIVSCGKENLEEIGDFGSGSGAQSESMLSNEGDESWKPSQGWIELLANDETKDVASSDAKVGGIITTSLVSDVYPAHFLVHGHRDGQVLLYIGYTHQAMYNLNSITLQPSRGLVNYYKKNNDYSYSFRIDPSAYWNDGTPITTADFHETFNWLRDPNNPEVSTVEDMKELEFTADSTYIFTIRFEKQTKTIANLIKNNHFQFQPIVPAAIASRMSIAEYVESYKQTPILGSGPYQIDVEASKKDDILVLKRVDNWWARKTRAESKYAYNFEEIHFKLILGAELKKSKFLAGELDVYTGVSTKEWFENFNPTGESPLAMQQGLMVRALSYGTRTNTAFCGFFMNQKQAPVHDILVRRALMHLFPFEDINRELLHNTRTRVRSLYYNTMYENKDNVHYDYNPNKANQLLDEAGWTGPRTAEGYRTNAAGDVLQLTLPSSDINFSNQIYSLFFQAMRDAGFNFSLTASQWAAIIDKINSKDFQMLNYCWSGGTLFNYHKDRLHSKYAEMKNSPNSIGYSNSEVDALFDQLDKTDDREKVTQIVKKIDKIVIEEGIAVSSYYADFTGRAVFWNKFEHPHKVPYNGVLGILSYWWFDAEKSRVVDAFIAGDHSAMLQDEAVDLQIDNWNVRE